MTAIQYITNKFDNMRSALKPTVEGSSPSRGTLNKNNNLQFEMIAPKAQNQGYFADI